MNPSCTQPNSNNCIIEYVHYCIGNRGDSSWRYRSIRESKICRQITSCWSRSWRRSWSS